MTTTTKKPWKTRWSQKLALELFDRFEEGLDREFSHESFVDLAQTYSELSPYLSLDEHVVLGEIWRDTYQGSTPPSNLMYMIRYSLAGDST
jgi:hypothetical protein